MLIKVKVLDASAFIRAMRLSYHPSYGELDVKVIGKSDIVSIEQKGAGISPIHLVDAALDKVGGEYA